MVTVDTAVVTVDGPVSNFKFICFSIFAKKFPNQFMLNPMKFSMNRKKTIANERKKPQIISVNINQNKSIHVYAGLYAGLVGNVYDTLLFIPFFCSFRFVHFCIYIVCQSLYGLMNYFIFLRF